MHEKPERRESQNMPMLTCPVPHACKFTENSDLLHRINHVPPARSPECILQTPSCVRGPHIGRPSKHR